MPLSLGSFGNRVLLDQRSWFETSKKQPTELYSGKPVVCVTFFQKQLFVIYTRLTQQKHSS